MSLLLFIILKSIVYVYPNLIMPMSFFNQTQREQKLEQQSIADVIASFGMSETVAEAGSGTLHQSLPSRPAAPLAAGSPSGSSKPSSGSSSGKGNNNSNGNSNGIAMEMAA
jgi:hypothetical protein